MDLLDSVRAHALAVSARARFVAIRHDRLPGYVATLPIDQTRAPELDPATHYRGSAAETLAYIVTLDALNFGSGYFPHLSKRPGLSGYFTVASSLKDLWTTRGSLSATELRHITPEQCGRIFGQHPDNGVAAELMALFARALNDLGELLTTRYGGSPANLVAAAESSAERLVSLLVEMPFYQDVGFYKRAQLTAADLDIAGVARFSDLDRLTIFADNLVPHVLRLDGVLDYNPDLLARIERQELIPAGSREEQEIRASAVHVVELIAAALRRHGQTVTPMQLDYVLWNRGQQPAFKAHPRHRARTVFY